MNKYEQLLVEKVWKKCNWWQKRKKKQRKGLFLVNDWECFAVSHFTCICFFNCRSCKCGQLSHNYIKCDLGNPNFSSATIVIPIFSWTTSVVHIFKLKLQNYGCTPQNLQFHIYILVFIPQGRCYWEISKFVIWFHRRNIISSWD